VASRRQGNDRQRRPVIRVNGSGARNRPPRSLKATAVGMLARREYSRAELAARLAAKGGAPDEIERLLDELAALGYLSDVRFAHAVVTQKSGRFSRRAIAESLKAAGVPPAAVDGALAEHAPVDDEALVALWRRRFGRPPADDREKARQVRFLQSRGFSLTAILRLLREPPVEPDAGP